MSLLVIIYHEESTEALDQRYPHHTSFIRTIYPPSRSLLSRLLSRIYSPFGFTLDNVGIFRSSPELKAATKYHSDHFLVKRLRSPLPMVTKLRHTSDCGPTEQT